MPIVGKLFGLAAILALILGIVRWPSLGAGVYTVTIKNRAYGFGQEYWAFSVGAVFAILAALYYWLPVLLPNSPSSRMSYLHFWLSAVAAIGFLLLAPGLRVFTAPRNGAASDKYVIATLVVAGISALLFLAAQAIFIASCLWNTVFGKRISP
jgi:cytochrome c oxidase subunit 1